MVLQAYVKPTICADGVDGLALRKFGPEIHQALLEAGRGKIPEKKNVQFCGLLRFGNKAAMFVPKMSLVGDQAQRLECATLTMQTLAKYGREHRDEKGEEASDFDGATSVSVVKFLADDFAQHGLFVDRVREASRNGGKVDWTKTLSRKLPFLTEEDVLVFSKLSQTTNQNRTHGNLSRIQASVLSEIETQHGWWLAGLARQKALLARAPKSTVSSSLWIDQLQVELNTLYSQRSIDLARALIDYLENLKSQKLGRQVFGVENFHSIWELMLQRVIEGVDQSILKDFPKPIYRLRGSSGNEKREDGMRPDMIVRQGTRLHVIDAKYYGATTGAKAPGWSDIVKQLVYDQALGTIIKDGEDVKNWFLFPWKQNGSGPLSHMELVQDNDEKEPFFPEIRCGYLSVKDVMKAYLLNGKISLEDAL